MRSGFVISLTLHAVLLGLAVASIGATQPRELKVQEPAVIADVISSSELNRMRQGSRDSKLDDAAPKAVDRPDEAKQDTKRPTPVTASLAPPPAAPAPPDPPKPPEPAKAEPPPPPPPAKAVSQPKPEPDKAALDQKLDELALQKVEEDKARKEAEAKAEAQAKAKAEAEAKAQAEADAKAAKLAKEKAEKLAKEKAARLAKAKAEKLAREKAAKLAREKQKKALDTNRLAALLDKTPDPKQAAAANPTTTSHSTAKGPVRGDASGRDSTISANEASFLAGLMRQAVSRCWNINAGLDGIQNVVVKIEVRFSAGGDIVGQPRVVNSQASPVFRDAADSAVRALLQCQPYQLPPDKFAGGWEHMILNFDPAQMF